MQGTAAYYFEQLRLMAPVYGHLLQHRQVIILPPRPAQGPPGGARPVKSVFGIRMFLTMFIATFCIFVATVLCWKFGAFIRSFTRHRVIGGGEKASVRYAKTWYGWVPLERHKRHQQRRREWLKVFRDLIAWRTCHADYSWVWWDPGGRKFEERAQEKRPLRWIPPSLGGYAFDATTCPGNDSEPLKEKDVANSALGHEPESISIVPGSAFGPSSPVVEKCVEQDRKPAIQHIGSSHCNNNQCRHFRTDIATGMTKKPPIRKKENNPSRFRSLPVRGMPTDWRPARSSLAFEYIPRQDLSILNNPRYASEGLQRNQVNSEPRFAPEASMDGQGRTAQSIFGSEESIPAINPEKPLSWRYKAWGARMQRTTFPDTPVELRGFAGRPGTPLTDTFRSLISTWTESENSKSGTEYLQRRAASDSSLTSTWPRPLYRIPAPTHNFNVRKTNRYHLTEDLLSNQSAFQNSHGTQRTHSEQSVPEPGPSNWVHNRSQSLDSRNHRPFPQRRISNPEVRLIDDLERKLEWFSSETDPGRKLTHFSIPYNHWLNTATWVGYDPACRVPSGERRMYGDPRCNYPLPDPTNESLVVAKRRPMPRERVEAPKINSWRRAVNGARKSAGLREFLKAVELFEGSAEEPPDGAIDTATWVLRKPPQGFEMSTKQKNAYFEGCGGWFEKLEYWQNVPRAYRVRRVVCEGGVNRRRVAEVAKAVTGSCKKTARHVASHIPRHINHQKRASKDAGKVTKLRRNSHSASQPKKNVQRPGLNIDNLQSDLFSAASTAHTEQTTGHIFMSIVDSADSSLRNRSVAFQDNLLKLS